MGKKRKIKSNNLPTQEKEIAKRTKGSFLNKYSSILFLVITIVVLSIFVPKFFSIRNLLNIFVQASTTGLMAIGMTAVLITGGIDLSMPGLMAFSGIVGVMFMKEGGNPIIAGLLMVFLGLIGGVINGVAVGFLNMVPLVVTLATMAIVTGANISITNAQSVLGIHPDFIDVILSRVFGIPMPIFILGFFTVISTYLMKNSIYGRWLYAVGVNKRAARVSGIPDNLVIFGAYVFSGFFAGITAIVTTARLGTATATMGKEGVVLDIITSAVIGGVSIYGGVGNPIGAVVGSIVIVLISNSMNFLHISYYLTLIMKGLVIIAVVALDTYMRKTNE